MERIMGYIQEQGTGTPYQNAGAPVNGTNEVQRMTIGGTPTGGTFKLAFNGLTTAAITWSATNNTLLTNIKNALEALGNIDTVTVAEATITSGIGTIDITFSGVNVAKMAQNLITVPYNDLTGTAPTVAIAEQTAGVTATQRDAAPGALLIDVTNGALYQNVSVTPEAPDWNLISGNGAAAVHFITQTVDFDDFTDGGAAVGTLQMTGSIPAGAIFLYSKVLVPAGFAGNTSAALTIGDGSDVDRYNTGTPSVFATAASGVQMGNPSGNRFHTAAIQPTLTVTANSDFTAVNAGQLVVTLFYIPTV
jgi:hypothetical protein